MPDELPIYVALGESEFRALVSGRVATVTLNSGQMVRIIFSDIGFHRMQAAIDFAIAKQPAR